MMQNGEHKTQLLRKKAGDSSLTVVINKQKKIKSCQLTDKGSGRLRTYFVK